MLPIALECGLTPIEFWEDDTEEVDLRIKAYYHRIHREAHIHGAYIERALLSVLVPMFSKKIKAKDVAYPSKPFTELETEKKVLREHEKAQLDNDNNIKVDKKETVGRKAILDCY